eukprot:m.336452 g.336452  ORF g.336452 m.336452 type:complete len:104 (+) comp17857_c0_seq1:175-486(+)
MGIFSWLSDSIFGSGERDETKENNAEDEIVPKRKTKNGILFIREILGTMFFDSDGDLAHEFYEETKDGKLRRITDGLTPQGYVELPWPRLSPHVKTVIIPHAN